MPFRDNKPDPKPSASGPAEIVVAIGRWAAGAAPCRMRTLLGSCVGVVLYDRQGRIGGLAHVVLPNSRGSTDHPGKYADTAIPALLEDLRRLGSPANRIRLSAKLAGGACMFAESTIAIGKDNADRVEAVLADLGIAVIARDLGGETGRRLAFDTATGRVSIKIPGGDEYEI